MSTDRTTRETPGVAPPGADRPKQMDGVTSATGNGSPPESKSPGWRVAFEFLERLRPGGPWLLVAIKLGGNAVGRWAVPEPDVHAFGMLHEGERNNYYQVHTTRRPMSDKAKKEDIAAADFVW